MANKMAMTVNGVTTTNKPGQEQYESFTRKVGRKAKKYCQYDYRSPDGELFSCIRKSLEECRKARDEWENERGKAGDSK